MLLPKHLIPVLKELTRDLVDGKYLELERDGRAGRLDASQISWAIQNYGRRLVEPPESAFEKAEAVSIKNTSAPTWATDFDLWTAEEGESDLTLSVTITETGSRGVRIEIDDLHLL